MSECGPPTVAIGIGHPGNRAISFYQLDRGVGHDVGPQACLERSDSLVLGRRFQGKRQPFILLVGLVLEKTRDRHLQGGIGIEVGHLDVGLSTHAQVLRRDGCSIQ